ncbi:MAG: type 3 dihydrofolate reductase [Woeseiaceae bacterium]|nr:type 3 dihydrofolate reductase [Woeseiaceae bacterium]
MRISLIVAAAANNVIGADGGLPWHLPDDFQYFKRVTMDKPIVMGRRTWDSIGRPLPGRRNIVLTQKSGFVAEGAIVVQSPADALAAAGDVDELMIIGGGQIYDLFFDKADRIYLTRVATEVAGDTFFSKPDDTWQLVSAEQHAADERHAFAFEFRIYDRLK